MNALRWARRRLEQGVAHGESGASLILALAFLTLFGAVLVSLVGFVQAVSLANRRVHSQGERQYAMAGAIDATIQRARRDSTMGVGSCSGLTYSGITVTCSPVSNDGGAVPGTGDTPANALLTVDGGITNTITGSTLKAEGPVYAHGAITFASGSLLDAPDLPVTGTSCGATTTNWKYAAPLVSCPPIGSALIRTDAGGTPALINASSGQQWSSASAGGSCINGVIEFSAGYYNDVASLSNSCGTLVFRPGVYYFDFGRCQPASSPCTASNNGTRWTMPNNTAIIGGNRNAAGTGCDRGASGVQFVLGGSSTLALGRESRVDLCPIIGDGGIRLPVIFGQMSNAVEPYVLNPSSVDPSYTECTLTIINTGPCWRNSQSDPTFSPDRVRRVAEEASPPQVLGPQAVTANTPAPLKLLFPAAPTVPTTPDWGGFELIIKIPHTETRISGSGGNTAIKLDVESSARTCSGINITGKGNANGQIFSADLGGTGNSSSDYRCILQAITQPFSVTYKSSITGNAILLSVLDGIQFTLQPINVFPNAYAPSSSPEFIVPQGATFASWGPVFLPQARFDIVTGDPGTVQFNRGAIMKSLSFQGAPVFRLGGGRRTMLLTGAEGSRRVQALVTITDYVTPGYAARVRRWNVGR